MDNQNLQQTQNYETPTDPQENNQFPVQPEPQDKKSKKWAIIGLTLLAVLSVGTVSVFVYRQSQAGQQKIQMLPTPTPSSDTVLLKDPGEQATVAIPKSAVAGKAVFEFGYLPGVCSYQDPLRSVGANMSLQVTEWTPPAQTGMEHFKFLHPVDIEMYYKDERIGHFNESEITIYRCDPDSRISEEIPSQVDTEKNTVTAKIKDLGDYELYAPLACPEDILEFDDSFYAAVPVGTKVDAPGRWAQPITPFGVKIKRLFDFEDDEDWFKFLAEKGKSYIIETADLAEGVDTSITLFDPDGLTEITSNDNAGETTLSSRIEWAPSGKYLEYSPELMVLFVRVTPTAQSSFGCNASYNFSITER